LSRSRIVVTAGDECDHQMLLRIVESMVDKLKDEVMGSLLKYRLVVSVWRSKGKRCALVDVERARDAVARKVEKMWDVENDIVKSSEVESRWLVSTAETAAAEMIKQVTQKMANGKTNHCFIVHS